MTDGDPYAQAGVDYEALDRSKRAALSAARLTAAFPLPRGATFDEESFGESASILRVGHETLGFVVECLGTKSLIASEYEQETGVDRFDAIGYDTVAAATNDCASAGALPLVVNAYFAAGSASFHEGRRHALLVEGFQRGCADAGAAWGGGESPALEGIVAGDAIDLAAAVIGRVPDGLEPLLGTALVPGDEIVLVSSSGLHQNGASLARSVARGLEDGWSTRLPSGRTLGDAALDPGIIYVSLIEKSLAAAFPLHYVSHLTGHGFRKLMRADRELTYRIDSLPEVPEVLSFIAHRAELSSAAAYATLNMGAGLACFVGRGQGARFVKLAEGLGLSAMDAGRVEEGPRAVVLEALGIEYPGSALDIR